MKRLVCLLMLCVATTVNASSKVEVSKDLVAEHCHLLSVQQALLLNSESSAEKLQSAQDDLNHSSVYLKAEKLLAENGFNQYFLSVSCGYPKQGFIIFN